MPRELAACVESANLDPAVHVIALAGNGAGFCGGYDLVRVRGGRRGALGARGAAAAHRSIPPSRRRTTIRIAPGTRWWTGR